MEGHAETLFHRAKDQRFERQLEEEQFKRIFAREFLPIPLKLRIRPTKGEERADVQNLADALDEKIGYGCPRRCVTCAPSHTIHERGEAAFHDVSRVFRDLLF